MRGAALVVLAAACTGAPPVVDTVAPSLLCASGRITVDGAGFRPAARPGPTLLLPDGFLVPPEGEALLLADARWESENRMTFAVPATTPAGVYGVEVRNPDGAETTVAAALALVSAPTVSAVVRSCAPGEEGQLVVHGAGFVFAGGESPLLTVGGVGYQGRAPEVCAPLPPPAASGMMCSRFRVDVPAGVPGGTALVQNPGAGSCAATAVLAAWVPLVLTRLDACGGELLLRGAGFAPGAAVTLAGEEVSARFVDDTTLALSASAPAAAAAVTVANPGECAASATLAVSRPAVLAVVPPVIPRSRPVDITVTVTGVRPTQIIVGDTPLPATPVPGRPSLYRVQVPGGLARDSYDVSVTGGGCDAVLPGGLRVAAPTAVVDRIRPPFGRAGHPTAVTVEGSGLTAALVVYLTRPGAAAAMGAVSLVTDGIVTGVAPPLSPGDYDVIAVAPDGRVGALPGAFRVVDAPPVIDAVSPGSISTAATGPFLITGSGFAADATVEFDCTPTRQLVVASLTPTAIRGSLANGVPNARTCTVRVTNGSGRDATYAEFFSVYVRDPAHKLDPFTTALPELRVARRAPAVVAGRATPAARFLYVLGGDDGDSAAAFASVESAPVGPGGELGSFSAQIAQLGAPRTLHGAVAADGYVYAVAGTNGTETLRTVERARILDPLEAPSVVDVALGSGTLAGSHSFQVSAVGGADGEGLPSDPFPVTVPAGSALTLVWTRDAESYRVYRDGELVAQLPEPRVVDGGLAAQTGAPLAVGALGRFHPAGELSLGRQAAAVALAQHPSGVFLYVGGGASAAYTTIYDSIEVAAVGANGAGVFVPAGSIGTARALLPAFVVDATVDPGVAESYVYFGAGATLAPGPSLPLARVNETVVVHVGGSEPPTAVASTHMAAAGGIAVSGALHVFGGIPFIGNRGDVTVLGDPPALAGWVSAGDGVISTGRALMGVAVESAHVFVVGGTLDLTQQPTATVESTPW